MPSYAEVLRLKADYAARIQEKTYLEREAARIRTVARRQRAAGADDEAMRVHTDAAADCQKAQERCAREISALEAKIKRGWGPDPDSGPEQPTEPEPGAEG